MNPLTHLLGAHLVPAFAFSAPALALLADDRGRRLVLRAIRASDDAPAVLRALGKAPLVDGEPGRGARALSGELGRSLAQP